jgi:hypothetical protein
MACKEDIERCVTTNGGDEYIIAYECVKGALEKLGADKGVDELAARTSFSLVELAKDRLVYLEHLRRQQIELGSQIMGLQRLQRSLKDYKEQLTDDAADDLKQSELDVKEMIDDVWGMKRRIATIQDGL